MKMTILAAIVIGLCNCAAWADESTNPPVETATSVENNTTPVAEATDNAPNNGSTDSEQVGRVKVQTIRVEDRYGTIEEERVPAMRSAVRYVPAGSEEGYNLVTSENSQGKNQNAHSKDESLMIPSWKMFSW